MGESLENGTQTTDMEKELKNNRKIILDLCGGSGSWSRPYAKLPDRYDVRVISLPGNDVLTYHPPKNVYGVLAPSHAQ